MTEPLISIIINTLNRADVLPDSLSSLMGLSYPRFEVIVVNGPSTDRTEEVLSAWQGRIKTRHSPEANLSMSRNIGIEAASGEIVAFIDDDAAPHPDWLTELALPYRDPRIGAVGGYTIDNTGVRFQVRKTICDRFGNAFNVSPFFDERPLCFPGSPYYPSLLGTNSSFRRDVLEEIGGFDPAYAYFLDETDVCLRVVDAGYEIHYAPRALVFHQFAASSIRTSRRVPRTLYPSSVSKAYFIARHGAAASHERAATELETYKNELTRANKWLEDHGDISTKHRVSLNQDVAWGVAQGTRKAAENIGLLKGGLDTTADPGPLLPFETANGLRIVLVSQSYPPDNEAGIARWTSIMAKGLSARGHVVHVIARAVEECSTHFADGYWLHRIKPDVEAGEMLASTRDLPPKIAAWSASVQKTVDGLKTFGIDVVSYPIWDVEGIALAVGEDFGVVMSLHTTYALAEPFKEEWLARPLFKHLMVRRMIAAEKDLLESQPVILANSRSIIRDLEAAYDVDLSDRVILAPHGTTDPLKGEPERARLRDRRPGPFHVVFVGRFEPRKGFDIAAGAITRLLQAVPGATATFVGDVISPAVEGAFRAVGAASLIDDPRVTFAGLVSRPELDDLYAAADVAVMPSRYESFGLVAIEAMAAGAPVVALAAGALAEVVTHGVNGFLVAADDAAPAACGDCLISLARDPHRLKVMRAAARSTFEERFTVDAMIEAAEPAYIQAAQAAAARCAGARRRGGRHVVER